MEKQRATATRSLAMVVLAVLALGACAPRGSDQDRHDGFYSGVSAGAVLH